MTPMTTMTTTPTTSAKVLASRSRAGLRLSSSASPSPAVARAGARGVVRCRSLFDSSDPFEREFDRMDEMFREAERMQARAEKELRGQGARTWKREGKSEERLQGGATRRAFYSESVTIYGGLGGGAVGPTQSPASAPSPLGLAIPTLFWLGTIAYAAAAAAFWAQFDRTRFRNARALPFALLWPVLFLADPGFRQDFRRAVLGHQQEQRREEEEGE